MKSVQSRNHSTMDLNFALGDLRESGFIQGFGGKHRLQEYENIGGVKGKNEGSRVKGSKRSEGAGGG